MAINQWLLRYRRSAIAGFLRTRRARILPDKSSPLFDPIGRRRVDGLRREELARAAGISTDYYVKLEQGKMLHPSPSVISSIAAALQLDSLDRRYFQLLFADVPPLHRSTNDVNSTSETLELVASRFSDALMVHLLDQDLNLKLLDLKSCRVMFPGAIDPPYRVSLLDYMFSDEYREFSQRVYVDWKEKAAEIVGLVHMKLATNAATSELIATVTDLLKEPAFRALWCRYIPFENATGYWRIFISEDTRLDELNNPGPIANSKVRTAKFSTVTDPQSPNMSLVIYH